MGVREGTAWTRTRSFRVRLPNRASGGVLTTMSTDEHRSPYASWRAWLSLRRWCVLSARSREMLTTRTRGPGEGIRRPVGALRNRSFPVVLKDSPDALNHIVDVGIRKTGRHRQRQRAIRDEG